MRLRKQEIKKMTRKIVESLEKISMIWMIRRLLVHPLPKVTQMRMMKKPKSRQKT
jgi:hypothetical protein